ncbi:hypothetical protein OIU74_025803 [Salix koriyanagi]|uniref:F-box associated domain-containing protein n=1 Tax=Salix koriyanagi TaxID=2511006 RepID=A0A9Q0W2J5_9ROSI|nr:hypothetical protein OIU74_025803 [Salix koriyanagi]
MVSFGHCVSVALRSSGEKGIGPKSQRPLLHYKGSFFNRIIKGSMAQFDLSEEKFLETVPLRGLTDDDNNWNLELEVLGDWLCLYSRSGLFCEAWIMKGYSSEASWTRILRFNGKPILQWDPVF